MENVVTPPRWIKAQQAKSYFFEPPPEVDPFRLERRMALLIILALAWYLRAMNSGYSSAYMDESVYVLYGRMFLSRHFEAPIDQPLRWSFGWYLWPMMAALADKVGGIAGVRQLAALLGTMTVAAIYGFARRVFSPLVGLASASVFAVLAPAVYIARIATRDSGSLFFFTVGLWLFSRAWQRNRRLDWLASSAIFFAAFLCKYTVAVFFPLLVLLALGKRLRPLMFFSLPLIILCTGFVALYHNDLIALITYGSAYGSLRASGLQVRRIYLWNRLDFWIIVVLAALAFLGKISWKTIAIFWVAAVTFLVFQWRVRADYDYWKHAAYPLLFLTPLAAEGALATVAKIHRRDLMRRVTVSVLSVVVLGGVVGWVGNAWSMEEFVFWPNVEPMLAFMEGRLNSADRVLADDSVFRYYFHPLLRQRQITDPFYFWYRGQTGSGAYAKAVHDGIFQYVLLDGGVGEDASRMQSAVRPALSPNYTLRFSMPDPQLGHRLEVYARNDVAPVISMNPTVGVSITTPRTGSLVQTKGLLAEVKGVTHGASSNWRVRLEVFTNHWYAQPEVRLRPDGSFSSPIYLGGQSSAQCHHLIRARLYDGHGNLRSSDVVYDVVRVNADGSRPLCR